jgi:hypothetical protein
VSAPIIMDAGVIVFVVLGLRAHQNGTHTGLWAESGHNLQRRACQSLALRATAGGSLSVYVLCAALLFAAICLCMCLGGRVAKDRAMR